MINNWRYVKGDWDLEFRERPSWRCTIHKDGGSNIMEWFDSQNATRFVDYEADLRFNSGDPRYFISIYNEQLATAFLLRWKYNEV